MFIKSLIKALPEVKCEVIDFYRKNKDLISDKIETKIYKKFIEFLEKTKP